MTTKWQQIWNTKTLASDSELSLASLIKADGFDTGVGSYSPEKWLLMVRDFIDRVELSKNDMLLEIGCGSGAFIYAANKIINAKYYGLDYSKSLIDIANKVMPKCSFSVAEANSIPFEHCNFDVIVSHSVFHYFKNKEYAFDVIKGANQRLTKGGKLCLLDLNDKFFEATYHYERKLTYRIPEDYEKTYKGLEHLFFDKQELEDYLYSLGFSSVKFFPHAVKEYGNSKFRFNILAIKC